MSNRLIKRKKFIKKIASEQITLLFEEAKRNFATDFQKSQRYVDMARMISKKCKVQIPQAYKFQICKHCKSYLIPGVNSQVRVRANKQSHVTITCFNCKRYSRYYIMKKE